MKKSINNILLLFLGFVLGLGLTVKAYNYQAKNIEFIPVNENWKANNIEDAINDLHDTSSLKIKDLETQINSKDTSITTLNTKVTSMNNTKKSLNDEYTQLNNKKTNLQNQLSNMNVAGQSISFTSSLEKQTFDVGFKPKYISCVTNYNETVSGGYIAVIYNEDYNKSYAIRSVKQGNNSTNTYIGNVELETYFTINNNGFTWNIESSTVSDSKVYCTISK